MPVELLKTKARRGGGAIHDQPRKGREYECVADSPEDEGIIHGNARDSLSSRYRRRWLPVAGPSAARPLSYADASSTLGSCPCQPSIPVTQ